MSDVQAHIDFIREWCIETASEAEHLHAVVEELTSLRRQLAALTAHPNIELLITHPMVEGDMLGVEIVEGTINVVFKPVGGTWALMGSAGAAEPKEQP